MPHWSARYPWRWAHVRDTGELWTFNSAFTRGRTLERIALARTEVVAPGVDLQRFAPAAPPPRAWAGRLAMVGRVAPEKGVGVALAALDALPEATLTITGPLEGDGEGLAHPRAMFAGPAARDAVRDAYAAADAVLFPVTWPEPFGLVPLEAMAVGRPVIATFTGGSGGYLREGVNALRVPPGDAGALAEAVRLLAGDEALRSRLVAGGRE